MPDNYIYSLLSIQHTLTFIISWITNRFKECGGCVGSKESNDCGICTNCQDKPKFGGPSRKNCVNKDVSTTLWWYVFFLNTTLLFVTQVTKSRPLYCYPLWTHPHCQSHTHLQANKCSNVCSKTYQIMPGSYLLHLEYTSVVPHPVLQQMSQTDQWPRDFTVYNVPRYPACLCVLHVLDRTGLKRSDTLSPVPRPHRWSGHETRIGGD